MTMQTNNTNDIFNIKQEFFQKIWSDPEFAAIAKTDPHKALAKFGVNVAEDFDVQIVCDTDRTKYIHIPAAPREGDITEKDLEEAVGGTTTLCAGVVVSVYYTVVTAVGTAGTF